MLSQFLAAILGWYFVIFAFFMVFRYSYFEKLATELVDNKPANFFAALMAIIFGLLIVISHNLWVLDWQIIITITGWLALVKGLFRLFFPEITRKVTISWLQHPSLTIIVGVILLIVGALLLYIAF